MAKNMLINAYAATNLGDDLFVKILCERYPETKFMIPSRLEHTRGLKKIENLKVIPTIPYVDGILSRLNSSFRLNRYINWKLAKKNDGLVYIGGSIFMEKPGWEQDTKILNQQLDSFDGSYYFLGCNFGPYSDENYVNEYKKIFNKVSDVCFRDEFSYDLFKDNSNVRMAPDIVFTLDNEIIDENKRRKEVIISLIDLNGRDELSHYQDSYKKKIIEISKELINKGFKIILMSFCEKEGDQRIIEEVLAGFSLEENNHVSQYNYQGDLDEALDRLKNASYIIATRFHAMILGWKFQIPVYPLIYSAKTYNVIKDTQFKGPFSWIKDIKDIDVKTILDQFMSSEPHNIKGISKEAELQFKELDKYLLQTRKDL